MATVRIPAPLRKYTDGNEEVSVTGATIGELLNNLETSFPGIKARICEEDGSVRKFVNIYANQDDIRHLKSLDTTIKDSDEVSIIPAIAGGC